MIDHRGSTVLELLINYIIYVRRSVCVWFMPLDLAIYLNRDRDAATRYEGNVKFCRLDNENSRLHARTSGELRSP